MKALWCAGKLRSNCLQIFIIFKANINRFSMSFFKQQPTTRAMHLSRAGKTLVLQSISVEKISTSEASRNNSVYRTYNVPLQKSMLSQTHISICLHDVIHRDGFLITVLITSLHRATRWARAVRKPVVNALCDECPLNNTLLPPQPTHYTDCNCLRLTARLSHNTATLVGIDKSPTTPAAWNQIRII